MMAMKAPVRVRDRKLREAGMNWSKIFLVIRVICLRLSGVLC